MARRVLIPSASVGASHLQAAPTVEQFTLRRDLSVVVKSTNVLELTKPTFCRNGKAYPDLSMKGISRSSAYSPRECFFALAALPCIASRSAPLHHSSRPCTGSGWIVSIGPSIHSCWPHLLRSADRGGT